jgi:hypothetical protein
VHPDLASFLDAARKAERDGVMLEDVDPKKPLAAVRPTSVRNLIAAIDEDGDREQLEMALAASF